MLHDASLAPPYGSPMPAAMPATKTGHQGRPPKPAHKKSRLIRAAFRRYSPSRSMSGRRVLGNVPRRPEKSNVCPSDDEPTVRPVPPFWVFSIVLAQRHPSSRCEA